MSIITLYTFENADGTPDGYQTMDRSEAQGRGQEYGLRVIANDYEWSDSEIAWDFTESEDDES